MQKESNGQSQLPKTMESSKIEMIERKVLFFSRSGFPVSTQKMGVGLAEIWASMLASSATVPVTVVSSSTA